MASLLDGPGIVTHWPILAGTIRQKWWLKKRDADQARRMIEGCRILDARSGGHPDLLDAGGIEQEKRAKANCFLGMHSDFLGCLWFERNLRLLPV
jgi:hypothetical protein